MISEQLKNTPAIPQTFQLTFDGQTPPRTWPSVSLCMIVKNEESNLTACLKSVGDLPGEIIIVDTGSTDRTVEIARSFGARVEQFAWIDDFAAARNESLKYATGDWILWLDADDWVSAENLIRLKNAVASGHADAFRCRMVSPLDQGLNQAINSAYYTLLFRNHRGIHFEGPIHETVTDALLHQGMTIAVTNIRVEHNGYNGQPDIIERKARRNAKILYRCVAEDPGNPKWHYHLGVSLYQLADYGEAAEQFERVINHPNPNLNVDGHLYKAYILLASAYVNLGYISRADTTLRMARRLFSTRRHVWITSGMFYLAQQAPEQATVMLERAYALPSDSAVEGEVWVEGVLEEHLKQAYWLSGRQAWQSGNYIEAVLAFQSFITLVPPAEQVEAYKMIALCFQKMNHTDDAATCWQLAHCLAETNEIK